MRILVAEDEADLGRTLQKALVEDGYAVDWTQNGAAALDKACATPYDTILLDVMMLARAGWPCSRPCANAASAHRC